MGKKYIIEVEDKPFELINKDGITSEKLFRVKGFDSLVFDWNGLQMLTPYIPYTEPDLEQVRKEAYKKGYEDAENKYCNYDKCANRQRDYQNGLNDAWECARKIFLPVAQEGLPANALIQIFGNKPTEYILKEYSAPEAIEKIRQYEQEQEKEKDSEIKVGDEVEWNGDRYVVTYIDVDETYVDVIDCSCGSVCDRLAIKGITKTGRHFPEIAEVLAKMKES